MTLLESISPTARQLLAGKTDASPEVLAVRVKVLRLTELNDVCLTGVLLSTGIKDNDIQLSSLCQGLGLLAASETEGNTEEVLMRLFGCAFGWLRALKVRQPYLLIVQERDRQENFVKTGKFKATCASREMKFSTKIRVLAEEVGEVAQAIDLLEKCKTNMRRQWLITEIVQVNAVLVAWLESLQPTPPVAVTQ